MRRTCFAFITKTRRVRRTPREHVEMPERVTIRRMRQRPHDRPVLATVAQARQMFADLDPRRTGRGRPKLAAHAIGRVGLQIKALMLRKAARKKDVDTRPRSTASRRSAGWRGGAKRLDVIHTQAKQTD